MILKYYPHKFANVEAASGITQEELDFVKFIYGGSIVVATEQDMQELSFSTSLSTNLEDVENVIRYEPRDDFNEIPSRYQSSKSKTKTIHVTGKHSSKEKEEGKFTVDRFWTEGEEAATKALSMIPIIVPRQEILACSMTA